MVTELKLPNNYILIEEEEMMYTEGKGMPTWAAGFAIDLTLAAFGFPSWLRANSILYRFGKWKLFDITYSVASRLGLPGWMARNAGNFIANYSYLSIGGAVAAGLDAADGNWNGWIL